MSGWGVAIALRNVLNVLFVALSIPLTIGIYGQALTEMDQRARYPAPGQLIDVGGGEQIHLRTWGAPNDKPTLLLFNGCCSVLSAWAWVADGLQSDYRLVAFDRPGMGWSIGGTGPRDADHAAKSLAKALEVAGIGPPYVAVAHSYGGFSARIFTAQHRDDVMALVLLDTSHPDAPGSGYGFFARMNALRVHAGLGLLGRDDGFASLPPEEARGAAVAASWTTHMDATADELETWDASAAEVRAAGDFDDLALLVVASGGTADQYNLDLLSLSSRAQLAELNVGHTDMLLRPDQAALVVETLKAFLSDAGL